MLAAFDGPNGRRVQPPDVRVRHHLLHLVQLLRVAHHVWKLRELTQWRGDVVRDRLEDLRDRAVGRGLDGCVVTGADGEGEQCSEAETHGK